MDAFALIFGQKRRGLQTYRKVKTFQDVQTWISTIEWNFTVNNVLELLGQMSVEDLRKFNTQINDLNWTNYFEDYCTGVRKYLLRQDEATIPLVRRRTKRIFWAIKIVHIIGSVIILCIVILLIYILTCI